MSRETNQKPTQPETGRRDALTEYIAALEKLYPVAKGKARVLTRQDDRIIVSIPLPKGISERMRLFDQMAEVGTRLLLETDQYIILSGR